MSHPTFGAAVSIPAGASAVPRWGVLARWVTWLETRPDDERRPASSWWATYDLVATMTCLLVIVYAEREWFIRTPTLALGVAGVLHRPLARRAAYWFAMAAVLAVGHLFLWDRIDNHKYLMTYWCLALAVSFLTPHPLRTIAVNARLLIGLCFLFAAVWKLASPEFRDGAFFQYALLTDARFRGVADFIGGVSTSLATGNTTAIDSLRRFGGALDAVPLHSSQRIEWMARFMAAWTILVEGAVAVTFLWPEGKGVSKVRDFVLIGFLITTYPITSVVGFGWLLVAMGLAQSTRTFAPVRPLYVLTFLVLPLYSLPLVRLLHRAVE